MSDKCAHVYVSRDSVCGLPADSIVHQEHMHDFIQVSDADRDHEFAERTRALIVAHGMCLASQSCAEFAQVLDDVHEGVYGTPCTKGKP